MSLVCSNGNSILTSYQLYYICMPMYPFNLSPARAYTNGVTTLKCVCNSTSCQQTVYYHICTCIGYYNMAHIKTYHNHVEKLVKCLPMDDTHFITKLSAQQLLPGDTENKIKPLTTQADKASYFLSHVIKPALDINETSSFDTLLCIMQNCDYIHVQKLAVTIKCEIDKSDNEVKLKNDDLKLQTSESQADETNIQLHKIKLQVDERKSKPVEIKPGKLLQYHVVEVYINYCIT